MTARPTALVVATLDTKGQETRFVADCLRRRKVGVLLLDAGIRGAAPFAADVAREQVALAGGRPLAAVQAMGHEGQALAVMCDGAAAIAGRLHAQGAFQGVIGLGGSMGTTLGTAVMRALPLGVPKVMVSTMASRDTRAFVGTSDILMLHAVCDLVGLNRITRRLLRNGALALAGMLRGGGELATAGIRPLVFVTTLGTTEACAQRIRAALEAGGSEVVVFHTVGSGGRAMEEMLAQEPVAAVVDLSLHEIADHLFGGDYDAGPGRGAAAPVRGIPTVLVPGNLDFLVTGPIEAARRRFPGRPCHAHNAAITVVRTTEGEMRRLARRVAEICRSAQGPLELLVPLGGFSAFDSEGGPLCDPDGRAAFCERLRERLPPAVPLRLLPPAVNDPDFADAVLESIARLAGLRWG